MPRSKPPHMDPMTPAEVKDLLSATMHGVLPRHTMQRVLATLSQWAPAVQALLDAGAKKLCDSCSGAHMTHHDCWCEEGHIEMRDLIDKLMHICNPPGYSAIMDEEQ